MEKKPVKEAARDAIERGLGGTQYELVDVQFKSERGKWYLNVFVDKPGGITLDDCEAVTQLLDPILDADPDIAGRHDFLTVSSPGLDRPVKTNADFRRNLGKLLDVRLFAPEGGKKEFTGTLLEYDAEIVRFQVEKQGEPVEVKRANIAKAVQHIEF